MKNYTVRVPVTRNEIPRIQANSITEAAGKSAVLLATLDATRGQKFALWQGALFVVTEAGRTFHCHASAWVNLREGTERVEVFRTQPDCPLCQELIRKGSRKGVELIWEEIKGDDHGNA